MFNTGRNQGFAFAIVAGMRTSSQVTWSPSYRTADGTIKSSKVKFPAICNGWVGTNQRTGEKGRTDVLDFVAWGKLADMIAKRYPIGTAFDAMCRLESYEGRQWDENGVLKLDVAGKPILKTKVSCEILFFNWGEMSTKQILTEMQNPNKADLYNAREANWCVQGHPEAQVWMQRQAARLAQTWDGKSDTFGYAKVYKQLPAGSTLNLTATPNTGPAEQVQFPTDPETVARYISTVLAGGAGAWSQPATTTTPAPTVPLFNIPPATGQQLPTFQPQSPKHHTPPAGTPKFQQGFGGQVTAI